MHIHGIQKNSTDKPICRAGIETDIENRFELVEMRWINLEPVKQSEVSQKEKNKYRI